MIQNGGIGGFVGTCGLCNIGKHDEVDTGLGITGCRKSTGTSVEGDGLTKAWGVGDVLGSCLG